MNAANEAKKALTIGRLIKELKKIYPDISSSKLRFLESQDLVRPKRGLNKYRIYTQDDVKKINFILKMQKEFYLPLDVIKQKLQSKEFEDYIKEGKELKNLQLDLKDDAESKRGSSFIAFDSIKKKLKVTRDFLDDLMDHDLIEYKNDNGKILINSSDMEIIKMSKELSRFGIQGKHLKMFENFAIRHSSFIQQIIMPLMISSKKELHKKGKRVALKLERELCDLHEMLLKKENRKFLEKNK
jgi:DNA-binding transcriptional MerR regulator